MSKAAFTADQVKYLDQYGAGLAQDIVNTLKGRMAKTDSEFYLLQLFRKASDQTKMEIILSLEKSAKPA